MAGFGCFIVLFQEKIYSFSDLSASFSLHFFIDDSHISKKLLSLIKVCQQLNLQSTLVIFSSIISTNPSYMMDFPLEQN